MTRLPDALREKWERYLAEGHKPYLLWTQAPRVGGSPFGAGCQAPARPRGRRRRAPQRQAGVEQA